MVWLLLFTIILTIAGLAFLASLIVDLAEQVDRLSDRLDQLDWRVARTGEQVSTINMRKEARR